MQPPIKDISKNRDTVVYLHFAHSSLSLTDKNPTLISQVTFQNYLSD